MLVFSTERLIVRQYEFDIDVENFFKLNSDEEVMRYIRKPKTRTECEVFLKKIVADYKKQPLMGRWAAIEKATGNFIGSFAFIPVEGTEVSQLGYALLKEYWGKGFATEMMREGIQYVFSKTSLDEVYGITEAANIASQNVLLKVGFVLKEKYREGDKEMHKYVILRQDT